MARNASQHYNFEHRRNLRQRATPAIKGADMPTSEQDSQLRSILKLTRFGAVRWKRTADHNETFTTAMKDIFVATVWGDSVRRYFRLVWGDSVRRYCGLEIPNEQAQLLVTSADSEVVDALFSEAKSKAFNLYRAIAQLRRLDS
jgi:hypothetical protein